MSAISKLNKLRDSKKNSTNNSSSNTSTTSAGFAAVNQYYADKQAKTDEILAPFIAEREAEAREQQRLYDRYSSIDLPSQRQTIDNLYEQEAYAKLNDIGSRFAGYGGRNPDYDEIMAAGEQGRATLANLPDLDEMEKEYAAAKQYQDAVRYSNLLNDPYFMSSAKQGAGMTGNLADAQRNYASNLQDSIGSGYLRGLNRETPRTAEGFNALLDPSNEDSYFNFALRTAVGGAHTDQQKQVNLIQNMTQEEIDLYHALLAREGEASANAFLDYMAETINQRGGSKVAEWLDDKPLRELGYSIPAGFDQWYSGTKQTFSKDPQPTSVTQYASQQVRENLGDAGFKLPEWMGGSSIGQTLYDIGSTTANMAPSIMAGALLGGAGAPAVLAQGIGAATMGAGVYGNSYQQALKEGFTKRQASNYAALTSLAEGSLQYLLGGISAVGGVVTKNIASKAMQNIGSAIGRIATSLPISMLGEGVEEYLQEVLDPVFRNLAFDENNEVKLFTPEAAYSGILGALTAGFLEGPVNISNNIKVAQYGKMVIESNHTDALVQSALGMPEGAASRELAQRISNGEVKPGNANIGELITKYAEEGGDTSFLSIPVEEAPAAQETAPAAPVSEETAQATPRQAAPENIVPAVPDGAIAATRNDTRQEVGISGIESVENGTVFVELSDGSVAPLSDVTIEDPDLEEVYETAGLFDTQTAKAFIAAYDGSVDAKTLYSGFTALYGAARKGIPFQQAVAQNQLAVEDLPDSVQAAAYAAGKGIAPAKAPVSATYRTETAVSAKTPEAQQAAPAERTAAPVEKKTAATSKVTAGVVHDHKTQLSKTQRRHVNALDAFAKAIGRKFVVQDNIYESNGKAAANITSAESKGLKGVNAYFDPSDNTYYISLDSVGQALMFYAMHENVHDIAKNNRDGYNNLQKIVFDVLGEESVSRAREIQRGLYPNESEAYIDEEIVANTVPAILSDPKTYEELARRVARSNSKTRQAFEALLKRLEQTFKRAYQVLKGEKSWEQLKQLEQDMESIKRIRAAYLDALEGMRNDGVSTTLKYSAKDAGLTEKRQAEYDDYVAKVLNREKTREWFSLAVVSARLVKDLEKYGVDIHGYEHRIRRNDILHIDKNHGTEKIGMYGVTAGDFRAIPYIVRNYTDVRPRFRDGEIYGIVYRLDHVDTTYYVEGILGKDSGNYLQGVQMIKMPVNEVPDAYKDVFPKEKSTPKYPDKAPSVEDVPGKYVQDVQKGSASNQTVPQPTGKIKTSLKDSNGNTLSEGQQEYFAYSKARDADGNLQVVYHGTVGGDFTIFDRSYGNYEGDMGRGFYFTTSEDDVLANYANEEGPDLEAKISRLADQIYDSEGDLAYEEATAMAREQLIKGEPRIIKAYLKIDKPVYIGGENDTFFDFEESYDEDADEYGEPEGLLVDFVDAMYEVLADFDDGGFDPSEIYAEFADYGGARAWELVAWLKEKSNLVYATELDEGAMASGEIIRATFEEMGFDGIIDNTVEEKFGSHRRSGKRMAGMYGNTTHYIVFDSNQAKYTDNLNPTEDKDIRFSLKDTSAADVNTLKAQNKKLTEALEVARAQTKLTNGKHVKPSAIKTYANRILRETKSSYDAETLIENLTKIYDYLGNATDPDMDLIEREGIAMTKAVLEKSSELDNTIPEMYSDAIEYLKTTPISLNETQRKEAAHSMDSYGNYRRALMGNTKLTKDGLNLDIAWQELSAMHPDLFPADTTSADMPGMLYAAVQAMKPTYRNPYGYDIDGAAADLFLDMFMAYADMPLVQTFADRKAAEKQAAVSKQKEKTEAAKAETKAVKQDMAQRHDILSGMHKQEMANLRKELNAKIIETRREARKAHAAAMREAEQIQKAWREQDRQILSGMHKVEMRNAVAETIAKERAAFAEWKRADREKRNTNATVKKYRDRITANVKTLTRWLTRPDKTHHVPEELRQPVANFVQSISFESDKAPKRSASWRESMRNLRDAMVRANEKGGTDGSQITLDPDFITRLDDFIGSTQEMKNVSELDATQLRELDFLTAIVKHTVTTANQMLAGQKAKMVVDVATDSIRDMNQRKARKPKGELGEKIDNLLNLDNVDSFSYFERLGDTAYESVFRPLRDGFNKKIINIKKASDYMYNVLNGKDIKNWTGKNAEVHTFKFKAETTFTLAGDVLSTTKSLPARELQLTTAQIMELYLLNQRKQARGHIYGKGIRPAETVGKIGKKTVKIAPVEPVMVTEANVDEILSVLTNEQRAVADAVQKFMENEVAEWGNDVSLTLYNYKKFTNKNYYPIVSDTNYTLTQDPAMQDGTRALENMGITKDTRENANNAIIVGDIFDTFTDHVDKMSSYNAYVVPVSDALKWYNYQDSMGGAGSTKQSIERLTGKKGQQYFMNFMRDLNGTNKGSYTVGLADAIVRNTKTAAVGANLRVIVQQPTSYARAAAMISPKYLGKAFFRKSDAVKARKYAPIAQWKTWGFFETSIGKGLNEIILGNQSFAAKLRDKSLAAAAKMDDFTWGKLWNACELEIKATRKDLEVGSEEFYQAVGKRLSDIVDRTQVVDSVFHRSQLMRSKDNFSKIYTAFGSEPNKSYNMLRNAVADIYQNPKDKSAQKKLGRVAVTFLISNTLTAAFAAVVDAMRDDDDEQKFIEKYWEALGGNVLDNVNPVNMIPYVKDIASLFYGYSSSRMDLQAIEKLVNLGKQVGKMVNGESKWSVFKFIKECSSAVSSITGIPAGSLVRDLMAIYGTIAGEHLPMVTELSSASGTYDVVYKAFTDGNAERGQKLLDKLYADKVDELVKEEEKRAKAGEMAQFADRASLEASARNSIERGMADVLMEDPRIAEAYELREKGMITELKAIYKEIQALGFKQDMVTRAINSYANNMAKAPSEVTDDDLKMYTNETLFAAVERGDSADIDAAFKELVKYSNAADPEKSITNSVKSEFKKRYLAQIDVGNLTKANQLADYVLDNFDLVESYHIQDWVEEAYQEVYVDNPNSTLEAGLRNILYSEYGYQDWRMEDLQENAVNLGLARKITAQFPDLDEFVTAERAAKYYEYAQPAGISVPDAFGFFEKTKGIQAIKDNEGETIKSKQEQIWEVIDKMNITRDQKDALHLMNYAASSLKKTPWH